MPASNARAVEKARSLACDVVILDLEDAVAPDMKGEARAAAAEAVRSGGFGHREVVVRINALDTPWGRDDAAVIGAAGPDVVLTPKIRARGDVEAYERALAQAPAATRLWLMIETPQALLRLDEIASGGGRLAGLCLGTNDLAKETFARQTPDRAPFWTAMSLTIAAARAHGLIVLDGVHNEIDDLEALAASCQQGAAFGFDGRTLIHPSHLALCNEAYSPPAGEVAWARTVIAAFDDPANAGVGALRVDGRLAERLHAADARRLVVIADAIAARGG